jgi:AhpD family alkylhydroperoxidase
MADNSKNMVDDTNKALKNLSEDSPDFLNSFGKMIAEAEKGGVVPEKVKHMTLVALALVVRCHFCIAFHVKDAIEAGATKKELVEIADLAIMMGGGPVATYMKYFYDAIEEFGAK